MHICIYICIYDTFRLAPSAAGTESEKDFVTAGSRLTAETRYEANIIYILQYRGGRGDTT